MSHIRRFFAFVVSFFAPRVVHSGVRLLPAERAVPTVEQVTALLDRADIKVAIQEEWGLIARAPDRTAACVAAAYRLARIAAS